MFLSCLTDLIEAVRVELLGHCFPAGTARGGGAGSGQRRASVWRAWSLRRTLSGQAAAFRGPKAARSGQECPRSYAAARLTAS